MTNIFDEVTKEVIGAFVTGIIAITFIIILITFGNATGQNEIVNKSIESILILVGGIGIPIGFIALIKWLGEFSDGRNY
jgi:hypothetical protein